MRNPLVPLLLSAAAAHAAFYVTAMALPLLVLSGNALLMMRDLLRPRFSFYAGTGAGLLFMAPHLYFLYSIFGYFAVPLWFLVAWWHGWFLLLARGFMRMRGGLWAVPFLWMGLEYIRCEVWPLKFAYLTPGSLLTMDRATTGVSWQGLMSWAGVYGCGALVMALAAWAAAKPQWKRAVVAAVAAMLTAWLPARPVEASGRSLHLAGAQLELPPGDDFREALDALHLAEPAADIYVFSEFTFAGDFPLWLHDWCRERKKHVILGGPKFIEGGKAADFENSAWVIGPDGELKHRQVKSVPVQFFSDGHPAKTREPWESPFGRLGLCICYDLNYRFVTDDFARAGMQALLVPTMDLEKWGLHQHELGARMTALRAVENGVPVFRITSSGISVTALPDGRETAGAPFAAAGARMSAVIPLSSAGRVPFDRYLVWPAAGFTTVSPLLLLMWRRRQRRP